MKKTLIIIATLILTTLFTVSVCASDISKDGFSNQYSTSTEEIVQQYEKALINGEYFTTDASQHTVKINGVECHQKMDGTFIYDGTVLIENVEEFTGYNVLKNYIIQFYINQIKTGNYVESLGKMNYVIITDTYDVCYLTSTGMLSYNGIIICDSLATLDKPVNGTIIARYDFTAISVDKDFFYVYYLGEIVDIINIYTGGHPRG